MTTTTAAVLEVQAACAHAPDGTRVLDGVSFEVPEGALVAIVGPTGAGKTSLVRALTGEMPLSSGRVLLSGADVTSDPPGLRPIGYVAQDDLLHGHLSLGRTLEYAARLRVEPAADRPQRIQAVLAEMGLDQQVAVKMSRLSVGQRKRANIAAELLARPELLVLDEPTSSLDPGSEKLVMSTLRRLSGSGRTVLAVTHSMHVARECDLVLFMAGGGRVVFFGTPAEAGRHFGWPDVPDLFLALAGHSGSGAVGAAGVASGSRVGRGPVGPGDRVAPSGAARSGARRAPAVTTEPAVPGRRAQLAALIGRYGETILSDRRHSIMLGMQGLVLGALLWTFLGADGLRPVPEGSVAAQGVAALMALCMTWIGAANSAREIVKERPILRKEVGNGLSVGAYMGSKAAVLGAVTVVQAVALTLIATARQHPPGHGAVLVSAPAELVVTMALTGLAAVGAGLLISAVVRSADKAMAVLPILVVTEFVLAGLQPAVRWIPGLLQLRYLAGCYWAVQATGATVSGDASTWWHSTIALGLLAAGPVILASVLTSRSMAPGLSRRPASIGRPALLEALAARARTALLLASASMLVVAVAALQMVGPGPHGAGRPAIAAATLAGPARSGGQTGSTGGHYVTSPGSAPGPAGGAVPAAAGTASVTAGTAIAGTGAAGTVTPGTVGAGRVGDGTVTPGTIGAGTVTPGAVTPGAVTAGTVKVTSDDGSAVAAGSPEGSGRPARLISAPSVATAASPASPGASTGVGATVPTSGQAPGGRSGGGTGTAAPGSTGVAAPPPTGGGTGGAAAGATGRPATIGTSGPTGNSTSAGGGAPPVPAGSSAAPASGTAIPAPATTVPAPAVAGGDPVTGSPPSSGAPPSGSSSPSGSTVETASGAQPSNPLGVLAYAWEAWWFNALSWSGAVR